MGQYRHAPLVSPAATAPPVRPAETDLPPHVQEVMTKMARLLDVSVTLHGTLNRNKLIQFICDAAADLLLCETAVLLLHEDDRLLLSGATGQEPDDVRRLHPPIGRCIADAIFRQNRPLLVRNLAHVPTPCIAVEAGLVYEATNLLGVPLRSQGEIIGVLEVLNKYNGTFTQADLYLLSMVAAQATVALRNATILREVKYAFTELSEIVYPRLAE